MSDLNQLEELHIEIGRILVESKALADRTHEYLEAVGSNSFADVLNFSAEAGAKGVRKKPNCNPAVSHHCPGKGGAGACVSNDKKCIVKPDGAAKSASDYVGGAKQKQKQKSKGPQPPEPRRSGMSGVMKTLLILTLLIAPIPNSLALILYFASRR